jgi:hypothetical protein
VRAITADSRLLLNKILGVSGQSARVTSQAEQGSSQVALDNANKTAASSSAVGFAHAVEKW